MKTTRPRRRGLGLPETLISLAIGSTLLVAVGMAVNASANATSHNDKFFTAVQGARVAMRQMLTEIRRADQVVPTSTTLDVTRPFDATLKDSRTTNETTRTYAYDATHQQITLTIHYSTGTSSPAYVLARNVTVDASGPFSFDALAASPTLASRVSVTFICTVGTDTIRLSGSAGVRRNSAYSS